MREIAIVILNYNNWRDTVECIESLKYQTDNDVHTIIVDNHSPNDSFKELSKRYKNREKVHLIRNNSNLGYAKGNNVGITYSIEVLKICNVLVINNDTIFECKNYIEYLKGYNFNKNVGVIGTKIIGSDGKNQNPVYTTVNLRRLYKDLISNFLKYVGLGKLLYKFVNRKRNKVYIKEQDNTEGPYILHGSALFFTENYLKIAKGFYPDTFLYYEENILAIIFDKLNLEMEYTDDVYIYHKEDQSSTMSFSDEEHFKIKYMLSSTQVAFKVFFSSNEKLIKKINKDFSVESTF